MKTVSQNPATVGEPITFTVREENRAMNTVYRFGDSLVDTLPRGLQNISITQDPALPPCTREGNTVTCPPERIVSFIFPSREAFELTIVATPTECGTFTNTATDELNAVEVPFTVVGCEEEAPVPVPAPAPAPAPVTQETEQESESGEVDQSFDVS